jgi:8-hydroxy-5-deazaflavin:NADPH oxidoreductase
MGGRLGTIFARSGHHVVSSYARSQQKLQRIASDAGANARAGIPLEAAQNAEVVLLAVHWSRVGDVLKQTGALSGKVVGSCSPPMYAANTEFVIAHTSSGTEELAKKIPASHAVSAFNTIPSEVLFGVFEARCGSSRPSLVLCGHDPRAKDATARLIGDAGFDPVDCGPLRVARLANRPCRLQPSGIESALVPSTGRNRSSHLSWSFSRGSTRLENELFWNSGWTSRNILTALASCVTITLCVVRAT